MTVYTIKKNVGTNIVAREQCGSTLHEKVDLNITHLLSDTCVVCQINYIDQLDFWMFYPQIHKQPSITADLSRR